MIIDCVSDTHGNFPELEGGDLLIVAGDLTEKDDEQSWLDFEGWIYDQKYRDKVIIGGNHDNFLQSMDSHRMWKYWDKVGVTYLCDFSYQFNGIKIWGSPWTKKFDGMNPKCMAFTVDTDEELEEKWKLIPEDVDILITHCPPHGILDFIGNSKVRKANSVGSLSLRNMVLSNTFPKLKLHIFGHLHEWGGKIFETTLTKFVNASHVDAVYDPVHKPVRVIL